MALPLLKGFLLLCLVQRLVDSHQNFGLPWRLSKHFKISEERLYRRKGTLRENSVDPHEKSLGFSSRGKTDGKSNRLAEFLKLNADEKAEYAKNSFKLLPRVNYHTSKATRNENSMRTSTTAVQSSQRVNKEYVFQDIFHTDRLNSYAVAPAPKEHKGTNWYITAVATVIILLFVVALCVYAPCGCLWKRHRRDVNCPIKSSQKAGMCSRCYLHSNAATHKMTYEERPHHVSVAMAANDSYHRQSSGNSAMLTSANTTQGSGKLKHAKSKVSNFFKGSQGGHLCEPVRYRYKPLKNPEKRESWTYEAEWTSIGAFLNKTPKLGSYGSTKYSEGRFVDRYGRRSRDSLDAGDEVVEYALKLRPRRRQVIELQEFPLGYSKSYLNIDLESDPGVVFDPYRDELYRKKSRTSERLTFSDSDLRKLSCTYKPGNYDDSEDLFNATRPRKSSLKMRTTRGKAKPKVVHFFPSNFNYDAQFVQIPPKDKMAEPEVGIFERNFNISYCESKKSLRVVDSEINQESSLKSTEAGSIESIRLPENKLRNDFAISSSKEHAVDCDLPSPSMDITHDKTFIPSRECAGSFVNYGCRSSTEVLPGSKEIPTVSSMGSQEAFQREGKEKDAKNFDSLSSSVSDLCKNDLQYKPEPLAGLLSPIRRAAHNRGTGNKGIMTSQAAGDLVCVTSYVQPLGTSKYAVPYGDSVYQPQLDDTTKFKSSKSQLQIRFETDAWGMDKTSIYEPLQHFPEKETTKKEN